MEQSVLDASALLAVIKREKGGEVVLPLLSTSCMSAVNEVEVIANLLKDNIPADRAVRLARDGVATIEVFNEAQAEVSAALLSSLPWREYFVSGLCLPLVRYREESSRIYGR